MANPLLFPWPVLRCLPANECCFLCSNNGVAPSWPTQSSYRIPPGRCKDKFGGDAKREAHYAKGSCFGSQGSGVTAWAGELYRKGCQAATSAVSHSIARHGSRRIYVPPQLRLDFRVHASVSHHMLFNFVSLHALLCCFRLCFVEAKSLRGSHINQHHGLLLAEALFWCKLRSPFSPVG